MPLPRSEAGPADVRVLVVEDEDDARKALVTLVGTFGVRVHAARDGREALDMLDNVRPDLILCDLQMPRRSALEWVRHMPPFHRTLAVAVTGLPRPFDEAATRQASFDGHLVKPISWEMIAGLLEQAVAKRPSSPSG
jgi:two-component system, OmpR family, response regulator